jgi:hypothetical protein
LKLGIGDVAKQIKSSKFEHRMIGSEEIEPIGYIGGGPKEGEPESRSDLPVHLAPMGNPDDLDGTRSIVNEIHNSVIAHANAVAVHPFELRGAGWSRLVF